MSEWKTIDSAPIEPENRFGYGPRIFGWDGEDASVTYWDHLKGKWRKEAEIYSNRYANATLHAGWGPTHWQPLPEPPTPSS